MRIRCKAFKNPRFNTLIIPLGAGKSLKFDKIGQEEDVEDELGYEIMGKFKGMLEQVQVAAPAPEAKKVAAAPENKMASSSRRK